MVMPRRIDVGRGPALRRGRNMNGQHYEGKRRENADRNQIGLAKHCSLLRIRRHPLDELQIRNTLHIEPSKYARPTRLSVIIHEHSESRDVYLASRVRLPRRSQFGHCRLSRRAQSQKNACSDARYTMPFQAVGLLQTRQSQLPVASFQRLTIPLSTSKRSSERPTVWSTMSSRVFGRL